MTVDELVTEGGREEAQGALVSAEGLEKRFVVRRSGRSRELRALDGVSFSVAKGESFGLVGESGSGKSTLARCLLNLVRPTAGWVTFDGIRLDTLSPSEMRTLRRRMQMVFQDPQASLDPRMSILTSLCEPLAIHEDVDRDHSRARAVAISEMVGISEELLSRKPHQVSGGQRQRVALARALILRPDFVVLDEPVSSLDVSVQAQVLNLLAELQGALGLAYLFIAHDLVVAEYFCDRLAVLYGGKVIELSSSTGLFQNALHPYTVVLLSASPSPRTAGRRQRILLQGEDDPLRTGSQGCAFRSRCPVGRSRTACREHAPALAQVIPGHWVACHFPGELGAAAPQDSSRRATDDGTPVERR